MKQLKYIARTFCGMSGYPGEYCRDGGPCDCDCIYYRKAKELYYEEVEEHMKVSEKIKELESMLEILKYERKQLHQSYIEARNRTAAEVLNILLDEPQYRIYVPDEIVYEIAENIYDLDIIDRRVSWKKETK